MAFPATMMTKARVIHLTGIAMRSYSSCTLRLACRIPVTVKLGTRSPVQPSIFLRPFHSGLFLGSKSYNFEEIKRLTENTSKDRILIDVREPAEYEAGSIPTSLNIPITSQPDAMLLSAEEFEDRFGFAKPDVNAELIFYCKAGVRSKAAARLAEQGGYDKVGEYAGSWLDWAEKRGSSSNH